MHGFAEPPAVLLGLAAALLLYLAAPNQVLMPSGRPGAPRALCAAATALVIVSAWLWSLPHGWGIAIPATVVTVTSGLSLWPFLCSYASHKRGSKAGSRA